MDNFQETPGFFMGKSHHFRLGFWFQILPLWDDRQVPHLLVVPCLLMTMLAGGAPGFLGRILTM
jgi:hypothetical protein